MDVGKQVVNHLWCKPAKCCSKARLLRPELIEDIFVTVVSLIIRWSLILVFINHLVPLIDSGLLKETLLSLKQWELIFFLQLKKCPEELGVRDLVLVRVVTQRMFDPRPSA